MKTVSATTIELIVVWLLVTASCAEISFKVRLFALGDSLTSCSRVSSTFSFAQLSYRECLWQEFLLPRFGLNSVTFVGRRRGCNSRVDQNFPNSTKFPNAHDAYFGRTASQMLAELRSQEAVISADITLLLVGTNDFILNKRKQGRVVARTISSIASLLQPQKVFVGVPLPIDFAKTKHKFSSKSRQRFDDYRRNITEFLQSHGSLNVVRFDDFNATIGTYDGIHPNKIGECLIAKSWFNAIENAVSNKLSGRVV